MQVGTKKYHFILLWFEIETLEKETLSTASSRRSEHYGEKGKYTKKEKKKPIISFKFFNRVRLLEVCI